VLPEKRLHAMEDIEALLKSGSNVNLSKRQLSSLPAAFAKLAPQFSKLDLSTNSLVDLSSLASCSALHWLDAHGNFLTSLGGIGSCSALLFLNACHNRIEDISALQSLTNLCSLVLSDNQIEDIKHLPVAPKLNNLVLSNNSIKKIPKSIGKLSSLQRLSLSKNKLSALAELPFLGNLEQLRLNGNRFEAVPACISLCRRLRLLDLGNNNIDDLAEALDVLRQISLRNLSLRGNPCAQSETYSSEVTAALPRLEIFDDKVKHHRSLECSLQVTMYFTGCSKRGKSRS
jgi:Leucine-rich repeat (LRR) protein